jgi:hypothetical protein
MPAFAAATSWFASVFDNLFNLLTWASVTIPLRLLAQSRWSLMVVVEREF